MIRTTCSYFTVTIKILLLLLLLLNVPEAYSARPSSRPSPFSLLIKDDDEVGVHLLESINRTRQFNLNTITVSGISSGAGFAVHMHYIFSEHIHGAGSFAGGPFGLAYNLAGPTIIQTLLNLGWYGMLPFARKSSRALSLQAEKIAKAGIIDPLDNLKGSKTYVFNGKLDPFSMPIWGLQKRIVEMYQNFGSDVKKVSPFFASHIIPTDNYGGPCFIFDAISIAIANCGFQAIFDMFAHFYGKSYIPPKSSTIPATGTFYRFDQTEFAPNGTRDTLNAFMNDHGAIYVPKACEDPNQVCQLHVAFHGCFMQWHSILFSNIFAKKSGFLQVADSNNIIMVFPYAATIAYKWPDKTNAGCWDWFGFGTHDFLSKNGPQFRTVANIMNGVIRKNIF